MARVPRFLVYIVLFLTVLTVLATVYQTILLDKFETTFTEEAIEEEGT